MIRPSKICDAPESVYTDSMTCAASRIACVVAARIAARSSIVILSSLAATHMLCTASMRNARPERSQRGELLAGQEVEHDIGVGEVPDLAPVGRGQPADNRSERRGPFPAVLNRKRLEPGLHRAER